MLTGIGADGTKYEDQNNFAGELSLGVDSPIIELPNDADPKGEPVKCRLRLFLLLISLDWLAAGDFGPFAASVSKARRPCGKCKWTSYCPCAFLACDDTRRESITHSQHCKGMEPRTHSEVMDTVAELRILDKMDRKKTARQRVATESGVFSANFASEHLLRNVVKDSTIDTMHLYFAGTTRYMLSWMTDVFIPLDFSWDDLNKAKNRYPFKRSGVRVPDLERSKGDHRESTSMHLNAAQTMAFAIARSAPHTALSLIPSHEDHLAPCDPHSQSSHHGHAYKGRDTPSMAMLARSCCASPLFRETGVCAWCGRTSYQQAARYVSYKVFTCSSVAGKWL
jgi:hypothetical protein